MFSLIIPVYRNEANLERLLSAVSDLAAAIPQFEVVFVVDGSPDRCFEILRERLPAQNFQSQLLSLSRNFGSFAAISAGLQHSHGKTMAVMAADLQEPPELIKEFYEILSRGKGDIVFGVRSRRADPWLSGMLSNLFWWLYRRLVVQEMPPGGVDIFGCTSEVRDRLAQLPEISTNLIALLFWLGFRRQYVVYERRERLEGKSAWTLKKKLRYCFDSIFNFTDLPISMLMYGGVIAFLVACAATAAVIVAKLRGDIPVPGYTPIVLGIMFFGALTSFGFGIVGQYLWLNLQNARRRPNFIVQSADGLGKPATSAQSTNVSAR